VASRFVTEILGGQRPELIINQWEKAIGGLPVPGVQVDQPACNIMKRARHSRSSTLAVSWSLRGLAQVIQQRAA
jgi:hypothetical protein